MLVSITRLRVRALRHMPAFAVAALRSALQAKATPGNAGVGLLAEAHRTFWTQTIWRDENAMRTFMRSSVHRRAMGKLAEWCDEAAVVHWTQETPQAASWHEAQQRMQREGRPSVVNHPTAAHTNFQIAPPRPGRFRELRFR
jgi:heme-degrading monooxygenase HmoA